MKTYKIIPLIVIVIILLVGCSSKQENENEKSKEKILEEISYIDTKIIDMMNKLNNIVLQNYRITSKEIKQNKKDENSQSSSTKDESSGSQSGSQSQDSKEKTMQMSELIHENILINNLEEIDWNDIKINIELVNSCWNIMLLDLYKLNVSSEKLQSFSNDLNNCIITIDKEDKIGSIVALSRLYGHLPQFLKDIDAEKGTIAVKQSKSYLLSAYTYANQGDWAKIAEESLNAENEFIKIMNDIKFAKNKENKINSIYISIKELQNSLNTQDIKIFFINYKNVMEKINIL